MLVPVHDRGGSGPPLLISHATGFCGRIYDPLAAILSSSFHVYAVDHRGHGSASSPVDGDMSYDAMARDLLDVVDSLELDQPAVFGHSMGATVALLAARLRPGVFSRAYLFEASALPVGFRVNGSTTAMIEGVRRRVARFASKPEALANFATKDPYRRFRADALASYVEHALEELPDGSARLRCSPQDEAECYARNMIPVSRFAGQSISATLASGTVDEFGVGLVPPPLSAVLPDAQVVVHEYVGHFGPLEAPDRIAADVIAVLTAPRASAARGG